MRRRFLQSAILPALFSALFSSLLLSDVTRAGTLQILPIAGQAYGVDGNNIVGSTAISHVGFLYDGKTYKQIAFPGALETVAYGISGQNIVGRYYDGSNHSFIYDGSSYSTLNGPPGVDFDFCLWNRRRKDTRILRGRRQVPWLRIRLRIVDYNR